MLTKGRQEGVRVGKGDRLQGTKDRAMTKGEELRDDLTGRNGGDKVEDWSVRNDG